MTRIETLFGGVLALGIFAVFAFVFFGGVDAAPREQGTGPGLFGSSPAALILNDDEDYSAPDTPCGCFLLGFDLVREGFDTSSALYESQLQICYDKLQRPGGDAFAAGGDAAAAEPRERRLCRAEAWR
jgi:hypothetical protein